MNTARPLPKYEADSNQAASRKAGELLDSQDLQFINLHRDFAARERSKGSGGLRSKLSTIKQKLIQKIRNILLKEYVTSEAEFNMHLVSFLNDTAKYVDARDGSIFWELIRKLDYDITKAMNRIELLGDQANAELRGTQKDLTGSLNSEIKNLSERLSRMESILANHTAQMTTLDGVTKGLEGIMARAARPSSIAPMVPSSAEAPVDYLLLENRFRGSERIIKERMGIYPPLFVGASGPILEIGPGRGELLSLLKEAGISAYGVDTDQAMIQVSQSKGLDTKLGDGLKHLEQLEDRSLGGIIAIQVVEHLSRAQLQALFENCAKKIKKGGRIIFETINPCSLSALSSNYFRDPTHVFPQHPDTLSYGLTLAGLKVEEVRYLSPVPVEAQLRSLTTEEYMTPRWAEMLTLFNHNIQQLNSLLYGFQDYCIIAQVP